MEVSKPLSEIPIDLTIIPMTLDHLPAVLEIENLSFPTPFTENLFRMELNLNVARLYVALSEGKVVGYIDFWQVGPEAHLITLGVHPDFRRKQTASKLVQHMIDECRKHRVEVISLDVRPTNEMGKALYAKHGFRQAGLRKRYYQDNGEDALVLNLSLRDTPSHG
jgi:ribosomal-protein-alanine N-acetyltransferase